MYNLSNDVSFIIINCGKQMMYWQLYWHVNVCWQWAKSIVTNNDMWMVFAGSHVTHWIDTIWCGWFDKTLGSFGILEKHPSIFPSQVKSSQTKWSQVKSSQGKQTNCSNCSQLPFVFAKWAHWCFNLCQKEMMELYYMKWIFGSWCDAWFFPTFRVVTVVSQKFNFKPQGQEHYWYVFQLLFVEAMENPSLSLFIIWSQLLPLAHVGWLQLWEWRWWGALLPVWVGLGGEAATSIIAIIKLSCVVKKSWSACVHACHFVMSCVLDLEVLSVSFYAGILTIKHESSCCFWRLKCNYGSSSDSVLTKSYFGSGQVILGFETAQFKSQALTIRSWRRWKWQLIKVVMWVCLTMRRSGSSRSWTRILLWSLRSAFWNFSGSSTGSCQAVPVASNWLSVFKLRLNRFCAFETLSWLGWQLHSFLHGLIIILTKHVVSFISIIIGWGLKSRLLPCQSERSGPSIMSISDYLVMFFWGREIKCIILPWCIWFNCLNFSSLFEKRILWSGSPPLRCDGGRKVTMDHVHENSSLLPFSCNLVQQVFSVFVMSLCDLVCHHYHCHDWDGWGFILIEFDVFVVVFVWPGPQHAPRWVWKKFQVHQEEYLEQCKARFKKLGQKAFIKKLNEIEDHYLVWFIAVFWKFFLSTFLLG